MLLVGLVEEELIQVHGLMDKHLQDGFGNWNKCGGYGMSLEDLGKTTHSLYTQTKSIACDLRPKLKRIKRIRSLKRAIEREQWNRGVLCRPPGQIR